MASINARIKPRKSSTSGEIPTPGDLEVAELALNTADGSLYTKHTDGTIVQISGASGGLPGTVVYTDGIEWVKDASSTTPAANNWASNSSYANSLFIHVTSNNLGGVVTEIVQLQAGDKVDLHLDDVFVARDELVSITAVTADIYELEFQNASYWNHVTEHAAVGSVLKLGADVFASSTTQELPDFALVQADGGTYKSIITDPVSLFGKDGNFEQHASLAWTGTAFEWQKPYVEVGDLQDVNITTAAPTDGQALVWDSQNSEWIPGSTASRIQDMDDFGLAPAEGIGDRYVTHDSQGVPAGRVHFPAPGSESGQMYISKYDADDTLNESAFYTYAIANTSNTDRDTTTQIFLLAEDIHNEPIELTVWRVQSYFGNYIALRWQYTEGTNGSPGFEGDLANLSLGTDVYLSFPGALEPLQAGDLLSWHGTGEFRPTTIGLNMLDDVDTITTLPTDGQTLVWDNQNSEWIPGSTASRIQDMDDYELNVQQFYYLSFNSISDSTANYTYYNDPGEAVIYASRTAINLNKTDSAGYTGNVDDAAAAISRNGGSTGVPVWISFPLEDETPTTWTSHTATVETNGNGVVITSITPAYPTLGGPAGDYSLAVTFDNPVGPAEGDILQWNDADQKFKPAQLTGTGAVDSVNGETGAVSLGIQDMDDFELNEQTGVAVLSDKVLRVTSSSPASEWDFGLDGGQFYYSPLQTILTDNLSSGDTITLQVPGMANPFTTTLTIDPSDTSGYKYFNISPFAPSEIYGAANGTSLTITSSNIPGSTVPLAEGDILQWDNGQQKFKNAQLATVATSGDYNDLANKPTIGDSPVDSVNGETGTVSLGIQDMDDYAPYVEDPLVRPNHTTSNIPDPSTVFYAQAAGGYAAWAWDDGDTELANAFGALSVGDSFVYIHETNEQEVTTTVRTASAVYSTGKSWIVTEATHDSSFSSAGDITFKVAGYSGNDIALIDYDTLLWDDASQKFKPGQLTGVVNSVNGETGDVEIGVEQLDNFALLPGSSEYTGLTSKQDFFSDLANPGEWRLSTTSRKFFFYNKDSDPYMQLLLLGDPLTFKADGVSDHVTSVEQVSADGGGTSSYITVGISFPREWEDLPDGTAVVLDSTTFAAGNTPLVNGDTLVYNAATQEWNPQQPSGAVESVNGETGTVSLGIQDMNDADTTTTVPTDGQVLTWVEANNQWEPAAAATGGSELPTVTGTFIDSDSTETASQVLAAPVHNTGDLLVACIMSRNSGGTLTPPSGFTLSGAYLSSLAASGDVQTISVFTKTATASEPATYTWTQASSARICGFIVAAEANSAIDSVSESYGNADTATIATLPNRLNITAATWIYSTATQEYSQSGNALTEITDSPNTQARISGGYTTQATTVTSTHGSTTATGSPNHGMINIALRLPSSISDSEDVDTVTTPPADGQVLTWVDANNQWEPAQPPAAPVDSVNGETGTVSLGIQDMDDFDLEEQVLNGSLTLSEVSTIDADGQFKGPYNNNQFIGHYFLYYKDGTDSVILNQGASPGDTVTFEADDGTTFTTTIDANQLNGGVERYISVDDEWPAELLATTTLKISGANFPNGTSVDIALAEGDILQWNDASSKFRPKQLATVATSGSYNDLADLPPAGAGAVDSINGKVGAVSLGLPGLNDVKPFPVTQTTWTMINGDDVTGSMPSATGYVLELAVAVHPTSLQGDRQAEMRAWIATLSTPFTLEMLVNGNSISATVDAITDSSSLSGAFYPRFLFVFEPDLAEAPAVGGTISFPAFDAYYTNNYVTTYVTDGQVLTWVNAKNQWEPADAVAAPVDSVNGETGVVSLGIQEMDDFELNSNTDSVTLTNRVGDGQHSGPGDYAFANNPYGNNYFSWHVDLDRLDAMEVGDAITFSSSGLTDFVTTVSEAQISDGYLRVSGSFPQEFIDIPLGATAITVTSPRLALGSQPLADGDILQWDTTYEKFKPAQLPVGPVDSVNGETGTVSLGIQDMDDYDLNSGAATHNFTGQNNQVTGTGVPDQDSEWRAVNPGSGDSYFQFYRDGGAAFVADFDALQVGNSVTWTFDSTTEFTSTVTAATGGGNLFTIADAFPSAIDTATLCQVTSVVFSGVPIALVDGDILQWNNGAQKFRPAQLAPVATSGSYNDLTDVPTTVDVDLGGLNNVDTTTNPPTDGQLLTWDDSQSSWIPGDAPATALGGLTDVSSDPASNGQVLTWSTADGEWVASDAVDGLGGYSEVSLVTDAGGTLITTQLGQLANLISIESDVATWVCIYSNLVGMAADTTRSILDDPDPGSGVLAEFYLEDAQNLGSGSSVSVSPSISIYNADAPISDNIYIKTRTQAGGNVSAALTLKTYVTVAGASATASGGGGGGAERRTIAATTSSLADQAAEDVDFIGSGSAGFFLSVETDRAAWITFYSSESSRTADAARGPNSAPSPGDGVLMEIITTGAEQVVISPQLGFFNSDNPVRDLLLARVVNLSGGESTVEVTVKVLATEN